jgi:hypothetical protein
MLFMLILFLYFQTAMFGFVIALMRLPSLGSCLDHLKYMLAGIFWPIYLIMWVFGYRLGKQYYLPCPVLDEWKEKNKTNEDHNPG